MDDDLAEAELADERVADTDLGDHQRLATGVSLAHEHVVGNAGGSVDEPREPVV